MTDIGMQVRAMTAAGVLAAGLCAGLAAGAVQDGPTSRPAERRTSSPPAGERGLLAGPKVSESAAQAESGRDRVAAATDLPRIPPRVWFQTLRSIDLTPEQTRSFTEKVRAFQQSTRVFQREHGARMRELQQRARNARRGGDAKPLTEAEQMEAQKLRAEAPRPQPVQTEIWEALTPEQRVALREALNKAAESQAGRGGGRGGEGRRGEGGQRDRGVSSEDAMDEASRRRARFLQSRQSSGSGRS